jgi:hypothetical protein
MTDSHPSTSSLIMNPLITNTTMLPFKTRTGLPFNYAAPSLSHSSNVSLGNLPIQMLAPPGTHYTCLNPNISTHNPLPSHPSAGSSSYVTDFFPSTTSTYTPHYQTTSPNLSQEYPKQSMLHPAPSSTFLPNTPFPNDLNFTDLLGTEFSSMNSSDFFNQRPSL